MTWLYYILYSRFTSDNTDDIVILYSRLTSDYTEDIVILYSRLTSACSVASSSVVSLFSDAIWNKRKLLETRHCPGWCPISDNFTDILKSS
jgi:hypothetical protein